MGKAPTIRVSKLSAARRQLDCALELWFADKDAVSLHTLAAAAHQIIHDINKKKTGKELLFDSIKIKDEYRSEFVALIKKDMNFFKHADKDAERITEFTPLGSIMFMLFSIVGLTHLGETPNDIEIIFTQWLAIHHPEYFKDSYRKTLEQTDSVQDLNAIKGLSKQEFLEVFLIARAEVKSTGIS